MWKVLDKELRPLPDQLFGLRPGRQCLDIVSFLVESLRQNEERGEKLFVISMDVASAFDSVRAEILGDGCGGERKPGTPRTSVSGLHKKCLVQFGRGHETRRPQNSTWLESNHGRVG